MKKFSVIDWRLKLLQLTILLIPFSYQPRLYFSSIEGLNLEFSLVQIAALLFVLTSLPSIFNNLQKLVKILPLKIFLIFIMFNWLSIFWSASVTRTIILSGYWSFLFVLVLAIICLFYDKKLARRDITNPLMIGAVAGVAFGWFQFKGVMFGLDDSITLAREAYTAELFGFARIQAFALEPQFYASSLIAPIAYLCWRVLCDKYRNYHLFLLAWLFAAFLLTVSRGGTLGLIAALILLVVFFLRHHSADRLKKLAQLGGVLFAGLAVALISVYVSAVIHPKHDGLASLEIFVDQMSHGVIDIRLANDGKGIDGLVEASTTGRYYMVERALEISSQSSQNYIIGIGAGSFGPVFQQTFGGKISNHVTNNQYVETFTELGIIKLGLFLVFVSSFGQTVWRKTRPYNVLFVGILLAYLVQYFFFSLQTNVIHIWLFVGVALGVAVIENKSPKKVKA